MQARLDFAKTAPGVVNAMRGLETYLHSTGLDARLLDLVKIRVSLINGWNRLAIGFRTVPGTYQAEKRRAVGSSSPQPPITSR